MNKYQIINFYDGAKHIHLGTKIVSMPSGLKLLAEVVTIGHKKEGLCEVAPLLRLEDNGNAAIFDMKSFRANGESYPLKFDLENY